MVYEFDVIQLGMMKQFRYGGGEVSVVSMDIPMYGSFRDGSVEIIRDGQSYSKTSAIQAEGGLSSRSLFIGLRPEFNDKGGKDTDRLRAERFNAGDRVILTTLDQKQDSFLRIFLNTCMPLKVPAPEASANGFHNE